MHYFDRFNYVKKTPCGEAVKRNCFSRPLSGPTPSSLFEGESFHRRFFNHRRFVGRPFPCQITTPRRAWHYTVVARRTVRDSRRRQPTADAQYTCSPSAPVHQHLTSLRKCTHVKSSGDETSPPRFLLLVRTWDAGCPPVPSGTILNGNLIQYRLQFRDVKFSSTDIIMTMPTSIIRT